ncbi:MAG: HD-GYP domain-containing protein [Thermomicrobiales bacterium]
MEVSAGLLLTAALLGILSLIFEVGIAFPLLIHGATSFSTVTFMAMVFLLPFPTPAIIGAVVVVINDLWERKPLRSLIFNFSNYALTFGLASWAWYSYSNGRLIHELPLTIESLVVILSILAIFYLVNVFTLNGYLAVANRRPFSYIWLTQDAEFLLPYVSLQVVGMLFAALWGTAPAAIPFLVVPAVTTYLAFETIKRLQSQTQDAMIAMADAIDARDPYTAEHSQRVTDLAVRIAEVYGLRAQEIDRVELAARVHDLGKIGISDAILNKPGRLEDHEWDLMKAHPVIGEQLLGPYRQFRHESTIVRYHHERWDGRGYPDGIKGNDIPIGSRIIAVADSFDAMTSDRPYRKALPDEVALDEIRKGALSQFDPQVVASFLHVMDDMSKVTPIKRASEHSATASPVEEIRQVSGAN